MPAPPTWTHVLTDRAGVVQGELTNADGRSLALQLNRIPTASFTIPVWHPLCNTILTTETILKVYRRDPVSPFTNRLVFHGPVMSVEESGAELGQTLAVNAVGPFWRLTKRFIGTQKGGYADGLTSNISLTDIARNIITTVNAAEFTGITLPGSYQATTQFGKYGPVHVKMVAESIAEVSSPLNGFDFEVTPTEPTDVGRGANFPQIGVFNTYFPTLGTQKVDAIFEYGTQRANVVSYTRSLSRENIMTKGWIALPGWPDGVTDAQDILSAEDASARTARGLFEDVVSDAGVTDDNLRVSIVNEHLKYRSTPRHIATFTVAVNARPTPFLDYVVGDWVRCRVVVRGTVRLDAMFRIWGAQFALDQNGNESLDLQLVQE